MPRREEYQGAARAIAVYLAERQRPEGGFPGPDNYGVAYALWLWSSFGVEFARQIDRAWQRLNMRRPTRRARQLSVLPRGGSKDA